MALGPRGYLVVTAVPNGGNRGTVRKWLTAQGLPAMYVVALPMKRMQAAYNDTTGHELEKMRREASQAETERGETQGQGQGESHDGQDESQGQTQGQQSNESQGESSQGESSESEQGDNESESQGQQQQDNGQDNQESKSQESESMSELEKAIARLVKKHESKESPVDADTVRKIVREETANQESRVIEIKRPDFPNVKLEGHIHPQFERVMRLVACGGNVLLVGPAGCGKTHMAEQIAKALNAAYGAIHGSAGASESALTGWLLPGNGGAFEYVPSVFVRLYESGESLFLFDELDAFDPNMLLVANGALANGHLHIAHRKDAPLVSRGQNARIMATANTFGTGANPMYAGRAPLDAATLDRFIVVSVDYDVKLEERIAKANGLSDSQALELWDLRGKVRNQSLRRVISTRAFQKAGTMLAAGDSWKQVKATLVEGWTKDEKAKVGMH